MKLVPYNEYLASTVDTDTDGLVFSIRASIVTYSADYAPMCFHLFMC